MGEREDSAVAQVKAQAEKLHIPLGDFIGEIREVSTSNPVGFDFVCPNEVSRDLLLSIISSGLFGYDDPSTLFGFLGGCVARRSGFKMSFRQIGLGPSLHIQIGDSLCNAHIDSVGIAPARDSDHGNLYDFSKIGDHWDRDLRPELGPLGNFDIKVLHGQSDLTGQTQFGFILSIRKKF